LSDDLGLFHKLSKKDLEKEIVTILKSTENQHEQDDDSSECESDPEPPVELTSKEKLNLAIKRNEPNQNPSKNKKDTLNKIIRQEMAYYEAGKVRGHYLQQVYDHLQTL
jgi:hypothetical protein